MTALQLQGTQARVAARVLATADSGRKNAAIAAIAAALVARCNEILQANERDLTAARASGMAPAMLDRLTLTPDRVAGMAEGVRQVAALPDPIGRVTKQYRHPNGIVIVRQAVPLGVIGIIYEARPNVTADAAVLCIKAGNAAILRGGKEAFFSNAAIAGVMRDALRSADLPMDCVQLVQDTDRASAMEMMGLVGYLDVLIPRGGAGLIRSVVEHARVPVIETGIGVCHIYVEQSADLELAARIVYNAKCSRPSVCNAAECLVVDRAVAGEFLPMAKVLLDHKNVVLRGDEAACTILPGIAPATEQDWDTEFLDYILAVKVVSGLDEALSFIAAHGTKHSEAIVTADEAAAARFLNEVDAAAVYHNASTRFTDGFEFGLGAEIGISTQKMHARGPMGLEELTSCKYVVRGTGQVRE